MKKIKIYHKNFLPHIRPIGATFFITIRLKDALPQNIVRELKAEFEEKKAELIEKYPDDYEQELYYESKRHFGRYDYQLDDKRYGECYLKQPEVANVVVEELQKLDGKYYELQSYCIMPNHIHILIDTSIQLHGKDIDETNLDEEYTQLDDVLQEFKGRSGYYCNKALGRRGSFWQRDCYDHYVRDETEWGNIANYIMENPVKAGIVQQSKDWQHSYYKYDR